MKRIDGYYDMNAIHPPPEGNVCINESIVITKKETRSKKREEIEKVKIRKVSIKKNSTDNKCVSYSS